VVSLYPPATRTVPSGRVVAVCSARASVNGPVIFHLDAQEAEDNITRQIDATVPYLLSKPKKAGALS